METTPSNPTPSEPVSNLRNCNDCGRAVSVHAESCPHCGAAFVTRKDHGVFYYVFWGVISLAVTLFLLFVVVPLALLAFGIALPAFNNARHEAQLRASGSNAPLALAKKGERDEKQDYMRTQVKVYDFMAQYRDGVVSDRVPAINFKIRNAGTRILDMVEVTVYFGDSDETIIAEEKYYPVLVNKFGLGENKPLKANYIWQLESGHFYAAKSVPSEWKEGAARAKVTDIRFSNAPSE